MDTLYGNSLPLLTKALDFLWTRQEVHSANLAHVDTPGYKSKYVTFEEELKNRLEGSADGGRQARLDAISHASCKVMDTPGRTERLDGNNVDATEEFVEMTRTTYQYQYVLRSIDMDIARLRSVIKGA